MKISFIEHLLGNLDNRIKKMKKFKNIYTDKEKLVEHICYILSHRYLQSREQFLEYVVESMESITYFARAYGMEGLIDYTLTEEYFEKKGGFMNLKITSTKYLEAEQRTEYTDHYYFFRIKEFGDNMFNLLLNEPSVEEKGFVTLYCHEIGGKIIEHKIYTW